MEQYPSLINSARFVLACADAIPVVGMAGTKLGIAYRETA